MGNIAALKRYAKMHHETDHTSDEPFYMVSAEDENDDQHLFVTGDLKRAEERHCAMVESFEAVKANWMDHW